MHRLLDVNPVFIIINKWCKTKSQNNVRVKMHKHHPGSDYFCILLIGMNLLRFRHSWIWGGEKHLELLSINHVILRPSKYIIKMSSLSSWRWMTSFFIKTGANRITNYQIMSWNIFGMSFFEVLWVVHYCKMQ